MSAIYLQQNQRMSTEAAKYIQNTNTYSVVSDCLLCLVTVKSKTEQYLSPKKFTTVCMWQKCTAKTITQLTLLSSLARFRQSVLDVDFSEFSGVVLLYIQCSFLPWCSAHVLCVLISRFIICQAHKVSSVVLSQFLLPTVMKWHHQILDILEQISMTTNICAKSKYSVNGLLTGWGLMPYLKHFYCQYQCNWLPGKISLKNDLLCVEWDVKIYSVTHCETFLRHCVTSQAIDCYKPINTVTETQHSKLRQTTHNYTRMHMILTK